MDKARFDQLNKERQRLQGSVNYWTLHIKGAQASLAKHPDKPRWQASAQNRLAYAQQRHTEATEQLTHITTELFELDPTGAKTRQLRNAENQLATARKELTSAAIHLAERTEPESRAYWQAIVQKQRDLVDRYDNRADQLRAAIANDRQEQLDQVKHDQVEKRKQAEADHYKVVNRALTEGAEEAEHIKRMFEDQYGPHPQYDTKKPDG